MSEHYYAGIYIMGMTQYFYFTIIFCQPLKKRKYTWLYLMIIFLTWFGLCFFLGYLRKLCDNNIVYQMFATFSLYAISLLSAYIAYNEPKSLKPFYCWITGLAVKELTDALFVLLELAMGVNPRTEIPSFVSNTYLNSLIYDSIHYLPGASLYFFFRKKFTLTTDKIITRNVLIISGIVLVDLVLTRTIIIIYATEHLTLYGCCCAQEAIIGIFFLLVRTGTLNESEYRNEIKVMDQVLNSEQKQYEALRENIDLINIKAHDIKHQLEKLQDKLTSNEIESITKAVSSYDKQIKTGNVVVDTVLYSTSLKCDKEKISFTAMADGQLFDSYPTNQVYYLLSNVLNNAIEATKEVENIDERIISLNIKKKGENILIEESNYFKGQREIVNGSIKTSKEDEKHHGFGLKSIRFIVNQNQGNMNIQVKDNMFFLNIILPLKEETLK